MKVLAGTGRRTGNLTTALPGRIAPGTAWVATECQGVGTVTVDAGSLGTYTEQCSAQADGTANAYESGAPRTASSLRVTADPGLTWAVAVGWDPSRSHPG
ncbi:hypothetical protein [Peterkaempfera griseoplana]|uniref:hypothetical protein n=1 Tax=Peterkaempfera griseoplana TaxID=66896 RepID=UPI0006E3577B|nr:hypothetical protein [Peterkaempfera griseoplana]